MKVRGAKTLTLGLVIVMVCASVAYAATFYATMEWPHLVSGYSNLVVDGDQAQAFSQTETQLIEPYDEVRAHCQLWENGHYRTSQTNIVETFGVTLFQIYSYGNSSSNKLTANSIYDGDWWVYGVHRGECSSYENDITSSGYVSSSKRATVDPLRWNEPTLALARTLSSSDAVVIPWSDLGALKDKLGVAAGGRLINSVIDRVVPSLSEGDLLPAIALDKEAGTVSVFILQEKGTHQVIMLSLGDSLSTTTTADNRR